MPNWIAQPGFARGLSLFIGLVYLVLPLIGARSVAEFLATILIMFGALLLPLACIWFGDELGEYLGALPGPAINRTSPAWMVKVGGWVLLLLPAIVGLFVLRS